VKGKEVQITSLCPPGQVEQKKREEEVSVGSDRGGDNVAVSGRLGTPWRTRGRTAKEGGLSRDWGGRRVGGRGVGGGWRRPAQWRPGELHRRQSRGGRGQRGFRGRKREGIVPKDLCAKLKDSRGLAVKQKFPLV
jgi:hypothetical protein